MKTIGVYAAYNKNLNLRLQSSSGAVFSLFAEYVLSKQGVVYGVRMSKDCYEAQFMRITNEKELTQIRGSKYLQAKVGNTYRQVREDLLSGELVLFSGTPCQVNGLKTFLGKDYDNLFCLDLICHGVPSPALWRKYAISKEDRTERKIVSINFRCKENGWSDFGMKEVDESERQVYISKDRDPYMQMFLRDFCLRPSCYECLARKIRYSDITIADFWGINNVDSNMNDGKGTSLILVRTSKGADFFSRIADGMVFKEVSYDEAVKENPAEYKSPIRPVERDTFFHAMRILSFSELEKNIFVSMPLSLKRKIKRVVKKMLLSISRKSGGGR
jgi:coenzyme F420-reducing hydrogenase beta subunit